MRSFFLLAVAVIVVLSNARSQDIADPPDLEVREFSWSHYKSRRGDENRRDKQDPLSRERVYKQEIQNRNSIENRSRDMRELEERVVKETMTSKPVDLYKYTVELMNKGTKTMRWVYWDYQVSESSDHDNPVHRDFRCEINLKPRQTKRLEALSLLPPIRVINAQNPDNTLIEKLIINRIEFADGTIWQRADWRLPEKIDKRNDVGGPCLPI